MYIYLILNITQNMLLSDFLCVFAELRIFIEKLKNMAKKIMMLMGSELHSVIKECINDIILWNAKNENTIHEQMVDEALIHSYEASVVIRHLCSSFQLARGYRQYSRNTNKCYGYVDKRKNENNCDVILLSLPTANSDILKEITLSMEKSCGWFLSCKINTNLQGHEAWQYEKKIDNDATHEVLSRQFIYHLCPTSRL